MGELGVIRKVKLTHLTHTEKTLSLTISGVQKQLYIFYTSTLRV